MKRGSGDLESASSAGVRLTLERSDGTSGTAVVPVLRLEGEYDIDTVSEVDRFLRRRLGPFYQRRTLVIDLGAVTFVDSSFIGFVVRLAGEERRGRGEVVIANPVGPVRRLLCKVGLPNLVPMYESAEEALRALREATAPLIPPAFSLGG